MTVFVLKMINGEDIIGDISESEINQHVLPNKLRVDSPASIVMQQTQEGVSVGLIPYMPYSGETEPITIMVAAIAAYAEPALQMRNEYSKLFGSGIQLIQPSQFSLQ